MPDNRSTERSRQSLDELRHIEGFPIGEDEDLLALSDPPHYTAYPNPHIAEFIEKWGKPYDEATDDYHREPFVGDISKTRNEPVYYANSYHTKVPYAAIVEFIEHYTDIGDVVFDGFCGSGMTGIAAQVCRRAAVLCDLSSSATFLAYNYNNPMSLRDFDNLTSKFLKDLRAQVGWLHETRFPDGRKATINFTIWSDVLVCPYCLEEVVLWSASIDETNKRILEPFPCPHCGAEVSKNEANRKIDQNGIASGTPVVVNATAGRTRQEFPATEFDISLLETIRAREIPYWYPTNPIPDGYNLSQPKRSHGLRLVSDFFTARNLWALAALYDLCLESQQPFSFFLFTSLLGRSSIRTMTILSNYLNKGRGGYAGKPMTGTLYVPPIRTEVSVIEQVKYRRSSIKRFLKAFDGSNREMVCISTQSATDLSNIPPNVIDYIFVDPPFGGNIMYSDLNFIEEAWLKVYTSTSHEAIVNDCQGKDEGAYRHLMLEAFQQMHRILKPNRWITVNFHNSSAKIWNLIQDSLARAGFVVAQVVIFDKQRGSFKQVTSAGSVRNDLVINAYKPRVGFTERFLSQTGQGLEAEFIRQHLTQLPVAANVERSKEMLYSKYLAYYVQHGYQVAYNAEQFYRALPQWGLVERDGYWFADEAQANEYEKRKVGTHKDAPQRQAVLFISDERSARQWLWDFLETPKTYDEIYTAFVQALQTPEDQLPEPTTMLEEGFVRTDGQWKRPDALTQVELETRRQARLLRQFEEYLETARAGKRLKEVRKEALVVGFTEAYRAGRFQDILTVGRKLRKRLLESSPDLFDFIDIAEAKVE